MFLAFQYLLEMTIELQYVMKIREGLLNNQ